MESKSLFKQTERGQAIVLMTLLVVALLGAVALAADGGRLYLERRSAQNAADNAALSGAFALCSQQDVAAAATQSAIQNGFDPASAEVELDISNPPASDFVTVTVTSRPALGFARLIYSGLAETSASATAECDQQHGPVGWGNGLIALNPTNDNVVYGPSSGCLVVNGGGIFVNSVHSSALYLDGGDGAGCPSGTRIKGDWIDIVGGVALPSWVVQWGNPSLYMQPYPPQTGLAPRNDPLESLPQPLAASYAQAPDMPGCSPSFIAGVYSAGALNLGNHWCTHQVTVKPGYYTSFVITADAGSPGSGFGPVQLEPGIYYVDGPLRIDGSSQVVGNGVMLYQASGSILIGGSGSATLTAMDHGPFAGIVFFMARGNNSGFVVNGAGTLSMNGTVYAPSSYIESSGSGNNKTVNGQMIADWFFVTGGGQLSLNYDADYVYQGGGASLIQLVQ